jgi:hypothetical protein
MINTKSNSFNFNKKYFIIMNKLYEKKNISENIIEYIANYDIMFYKDMLITNLDSYKNYSTLFLNNVFQRINETNLNKTFTSENLIQLFELFYSELEDLEYSGWFQNLSDLHVLDFFKWLYKRNDWNNIELYFAFQCSCKYNDIVFAKLLLDDLKINKNCCIQNGFKKAFINNCIEIIEWLYKDYQDIINPFIDLHKSLILENANTIHSNKTLTWFYNTILDHEITEDDYYNFYKEFNIELIELLDKKNIKLKSVNKLLDLNYEIFNPIYKDYLNYDKDQYFIIIKKILENYLLFVKNINLLYVYNCNNLFTDIDFKNINDTKNNEILLNFSEKDKLHLSYPIVSQIFFSILSHKNIYFKEIFTFFLNNLPIYIEKEIIIKNIKKDTINYCHLLRLDSVMYLYENNMINYEELLINYVSNNSNLINFYFRNDNDDYFLDIIKYFYNNNKVNEELQIKLLNNISSCNYQLIKFLYNFNSKLFLQSKNKIKDYYLYQYLLINSIDNNDIEIFNKIIKFDKNYNNYRLIYNSIIVYLKKYYLIKKNNSNYPIYIINKKKYELLKIIKDLYPENIEINIIDHIESYDQRGKKCSIHKIYNETCLDCKIEFHIDLKLRIQMENNKNINFNESKCSICYNQFNIPVCIQKCNHIFCLNCIREWIIKKNNCPICRNEFCKSDLINLHYEDVYFYINWNLSPDSNFNDSLYI